MAKLVEYTVARAHQGDRITDEGTEVHLFREGETRLANPAIVAALVKSGVLVPPDGSEPAEDPPVKTETETPAPAGKAAPAPSNKAEPKPDNKADTGGQSKGA